MARDSLSHKGDSHQFCWICEQGWVASDDPIVTHPRTGVWAHKRCCDKTTAGAVWRVNVRIAELWREVKKTLPRKRSKPKIVEFAGEGGVPLSTWAVRAGMLITRTDYSHGDQRLVCELEMTKARQAYVCPVHGLIEQPTWHEDEIPEDSVWYCPINLTGKAGAMHDGITDEVCGKTVTGPFSVAFRETRRDGNVTES